MSGKEGSTSGLWRCEKSGGASGCTAAEWRECACVWLWGGCVRLHVAACDWLRVLACMGEKCLHAVVRGVCG